MPDPNSQHWIALSIIPATSSLGTIAVSPFGPLHLFMVCVYCLKISSFCPILLACALQGISCFFVLQTVFLCSSVLETGCRYRWGILHCQYLSQDDCSGTPILCYYAFILKCGCILLCYLYPMKHSFPIAKVALNGAPPVVHSSLFFMPINIITLFLWLISTAKLFSPPVHGG